MKATLQEIAGHIDARYGAGTTNVWYMRPKYFRNGIMGYTWLKDHVLLPDPSNLRMTHVLLGTLDTDDLEEIYDMMQAERWSPSGKARALIEELGLGHTSLSVGDVVQTTDKVFIADLDGFQQLAAPPILPPAAVIQAAQKRPCPYCAIGSCRVHAW